MPLGYPCEYEASKVAAGDQQGQSGRGPKQGERSLGRRSKSGETTPHGGQWDSDLLKILPVIVSNAGASESTSPLRHYDGEVRQIAVLHGSRRPALLITNDFESSLAALLRRYAQRWLVEKSISEQLAFFHLNRLSSSMVIKVDFDLAMTVLAYNLYRLLALELPPGYRHGTALTLFESLLETGADIQLDPDLCTVSLKKKRAGGRSPAAVR